MRTQECLPFAIDRSDDTRLVAAAQAGDRRALDELLRRHHDMVHSICRRLAGNDADGLDATQEALIAIVRGLPRFGGSGPVLHLGLPGCHQRRALDEIRRRSRRPTPALPTDAGRPIAATAAADPADAAVRLDIDDALAALPEEFRAPVVPARCGWLRLRRDRNDPTNTARHGPIADSARPSPAGPDAEPRQRARRRRELRHATATS